MGKHTKSGRTRGDVCKSTNKANKQTFNCIEGAILRRPNWLSSYIKDGKADLLTTLRGNIFLAHKIRNSKLRNKKKKAKRTLETTFLMRYLFYSCVWALQRIIWWNFALRQACCRKSFSIYPMQFFSSLCHSSLDNREKINKVRHNGIFTTVLLKALLRAFLLSIHLCPFQIAFLR